MELLGGSGDEPWNLTLVKELGWRELEKMIGVALRSDGYDVEVTRPVKDGGIDVDASKIDLFKSLLFRPKIVPRRKRLIVDAKQWKTPVDAGSVEKIADVADEEGGTGVIASPSGFRKSAKRVASNRGVKLYDGDDIVELFNRTGIDKSDIEQT
jgi:HJR/Mrr/RecB family endonuclease